MLYRGFATQQEIDAEYNVSARRDDLDDVNRRIAQLNERALGLPGVELGLRYGPTRDEYLDVFRGAGEEPRPVLVFIHGGYWRAYGSRDFALAALGPVAHGIDVVTTNYSLAPKVSIDEITRQNRAAVAWVHAHAASWGGDPSRIVVAGHSAGGHQTAMVLATDWERDYDLPADIVRAGLPISGLFDLRPFPYSYLAPALQLSRRTIETQSPVLAEVGGDRVGGPRRIVAWGGGETSEVPRQSLAYVERCRAAGIDARPLALGSDDHFDSVLQLAEPGSELTRAVLELSRASG
jgi:arylformamidase